MRPFEILSWAAGAALYVFVFAMISAVVGPSAILTVLWFGTAHLLLARQYRRHRQRRAPLRDTD